MQSLEEKTKEIEDVILNQPTSKSADRYIKLLRDRFFEEDRERTVITSLIRYRSTGFLTLAYLFDNTLREIAQEELEREKAMQR